MNATQIYTIVNSLAEQSLGMTGLTATDASFISVGKEVLATDKNTEQFYKTLADRIGKTVFAIREYRNKNKALLAEGVEFGIALQKITFDLLTAKENKSWVGMETNPFEVFNSNVKQSIFSVMSVWEFDLTVWDRQLRTAFINGLMTAFYNSMELAEENLGNIAKASLIARKKDKAINLLHEYNTLTNAGLTVESALRNTEFLKWASMTINLFVNRMKRMSTLFNEEGYKRHTPLDDMVVVMLDNFTASVSTYLESDTFHNELVKLPMFKSVPYWQGSGNDYSFDSVSSIKIKLDATTTVEESGIVGVIYDYQALGVTFDKPKATNERNNHDEYTNYYYKFNKGYFNDMSENGIVFYLKEQV